jgi:hypothetical protein
MSVGPVRKYKLGYDNYFDDAGEQKPGQPFIVDLVTLEKMFFQGIPDEIDYTPDAGWVAVQSPGRNNAFYQYTGGEDTLVLPLTFYCDEPSRESVIRKCKWLEALSRNNAYAEKPHHVGFYFGNMYRASKWIVHSVNYKLRLPDRSFGMLPQYASVEVTLKRITETNRTRNQILQIDT